VTADEQPRAEDGLTRPVELAKAMLVMWVDPDAVTVEQAEEWAESIVRGLFASGVVVLARTHIAKQAVLDLADDLYERGSHGGPDGDAYGDSATELRDLAARQGS
jgi:hypothetical protein